MSYGDVVSDPAVIVPLIGNGLERLPRGPHRLSREEVERSQRDRLLLGAVMAVSEKGFAATTVTDILRGAGVSRTTFYQLFDDKLDCFLAANRMASEVLTEIMADRVRSMGEAFDDLSALDRLDRLLRAYLESLVEFHVLARVFLIEVYAAGVEAIEQRRASLDAFAELVATTLEAHENIADRADALAVAEVLVAAVSSIVTNAVGVGEGDRLVELHGSLMAVARRFLSVPA